MTEQTITRAHLNEAVYQEVGLSRNECAGLVESVLDEISDALARGEMVKISSFGSFAVRQKGGRVGRNPKTGEVVPILPRRVLVNRRMIVREMNRVGMLIDLSHTGYRTCMDVFEISSAPVCFTHSNPLGLWDNPRNIRDDQIRACARSGGVVGVNGIGLHMGDNDASSEKICDQIDYVANLVGPAHVGIGLSYVYDNGACMADFNARAAWAVDASLAPLVSRSLTPAEYAFASPERMPELSEVLLRRGHYAQAVRSILGGNWLRVLSATWK